MPDSLPPLSLYIHLPWCVRKCPYCDFNSHRAGNDAPRQRYVAALIKDIQKESVRAGERPVETIFLGGGTPSLFAPEEIAAVLEASRNCLHLTEHCEITMEANPGTLERGALAQYRQAGVTRLSIGAQSFAADMLKVLGRIHGPDDIRLAYEEASRADFESINIDLMFALPGQTLAAAISDVEALIELGPPHVSYYQLTLEPNTVFYRQPPPNIPDDDLAWEIQEVCHARLAQAGYARYEISAFARGKHRCRHNLNYWLFGDYLAAGAGAHGKLTDKPGHVCRYRKPANPLSYMEWAELSAAEPSMARIADEELVFEFMLNALRLEDGFEEADFCQRTGVEFGLAAGPLHQALRDGLIEQNVPGHWRPTTTGFRFLNDLQARFLGAVRPEGTAR